VTDYYWPGTPSYSENTAGYGLTRESMKWFWDHYLNVLGEAANPYAAPLKARDLAGLPPAFVMTANTTRCAMRASACRKAAGGRRSDLAVAPGRDEPRLPVLLGVVDRAGPAMADACDWLRHVFGHAR
jgi:acetyl esterase